MVPHVAGWPYDSTAKPTTEQTETQQNPPDSNSELSAETLIAWLATEHDLSPGSRLRNNPAVRMA